MKDLVRYHDEDAGAVKPARHRSQKRVVEIPQEDAESRPGFSAPDKATDLLHLGREGSGIERDLS